MFIKNRTFKDEETLLEVIFDFGLGEPTPFVTEITTTIDNELQQNEAYNNYLKTLTDEEDRMELETEERAIRLAEHLMAQFDSFTVKSAKLYGNKGEDNTLLYEMELH